MLFLRKDSYGTVHFCAPLWREEREKVFRTIASGTVYKGEKIWYNRIIMEGISEREYIMISGATGGVGKAFAFACAPRGALFLTGRSSEKLLHLKSELEETFGGIAVDFFACDLADEKQREAMFAYIQGKGYRFGGLCNVAGVDIQKAFEKYTQEKIVFQARVNFEAALSLTHFVLHNRAPRLDIVTVSSLSGVYPMPYFAEYSATKCALTSFFFLLAAGIEKEKRARHGGRARRDLHAAGYLREYQRAGTLGKTFGKEAGIHSEKKPRGGRKEQAVDPPGFLE